MYTEQHKELAFAWESVGMPLDDIALMHLTLKEKLKKEEDHTKFLGMLLKILWGEGWEKLTIAEAERYIRVAIRFAEEEAIWNEVKDK